MLVGIAKCSYLWIQSNYENKANVSHISFIVGLTHYQLKKEFETSIPPSSLVFLLAFLVPFPFLSNLMSAYCTKYSTSCRDGLVSLPSCMSDETSGNKSNCSSS